MIKITSQRQRPAAYLFESLPCERQAGMETAGRVFLLNSAVVTTGPSKPVSDFNRTGASVIDDILELVTEGEGRIWGNRCTIIRPNL